MRKLKYQWPGKKATIGCERLGKKDLNTLYCFMFFSLKCYRNSEEVSAGQNNSFF